MAIFLPCAIADNQPLAIPLKQKEQIETQILIEEWGEYTSTSRTAKARFDSKDVLLKCELFDDALADEISATKVMASLSVYIVYLTTVFQKLVERRSDWNYEKLVGKEYVLMPLANIQHNGRSCIVYPVILGHSLKEFTRNMSLREKMKCLPRILVHALKGNSSNS
jgi:hypothetical protein